MILVSILWELYILIYSKRVGAGKTIFYSVVTLLLGCGTHTHNWDSTKISSNNLKNSVIVILKKMVQNQCDFQGFWIENKNKAAKFWEEAVECVFVHIDCSHSMYCSFFLSSSPCFMCINWIIHGRKDEWASKFVHPTAFLNFCISPSGFSVHDLLYAWH